jgi:hypothetical protein
MAGARSSSGLVVGNKLTINDLFKAVKLCILDRSASC